MRALLVLLLRVAGVKDPTMIVSLGPALRAGLLSISTLATFVYDNMDQETPEAQALARVLQHINTLVTVISELLPVTEVTELSVLDRGDLDILAKVGFPDASGKL